MAAGREIGSDDVVANLDARDAGPDRNHVADEFMADDGAALNALEMTGDDMKIGPAYARHRDTNERVGRADEFGRRDVPQGHLARSVEDDRPHGHPSSRTRAAMLDAARASAAFSAAVSGSVTISRTPVRQSRTGKPRRVSSTP